jgi:hypothetical protein
MTDVAPDWSHPFDDPIPLPDGRVLRTLADAGFYVAALSEAEQQRIEWRAAAEILLKAAEGRSVVTLAQAAMLQALLLDQQRRHVEP